MNHNGVISLPTDGAATYKAGGVVGINSSGQAAESTFAAKGLGVVLHDVKADETARPVDIQLFSGGGICLVLVDAKNESGGIAIGDPVGFANGSHQAEKGGTTTIGYAAEAVSAITKDDGTVIRVIL